MKTKKNPKAHCCLVLQLSLLPGDGDEEQGSWYGDGWRTETCSSPGPCISEVFAVRDVNAYLT